MSAFGSRLKGKVAVITASTEGIGFAIANRLAGEGASVVISSRKEANVEKAVKILRDKGYNVHGTKCHVGTAIDRVNLFQEAVKKYGGVDIFVSNAAVNPAIGSVLTCTEEQWDKIFDINVKASLLLVKEAVPLIKQRGGGSIVFISSVAGYNPMPLLGAYSVSKTALFGLTKALSQDLAGQNIRVNCVAPGVTRTKFAGALISQEGIISGIPLGRAAEPDEIAGATAFLASNDSSYVTGETITVAGGLPSRL